MAQIRENRSLLHLVIMHIDFVRELDLLELLRRLILAFGLLLLLQFVAQLVVVDDLAHRRVRLRAHHH